MKICKICKQEKPLSNFPRSGYKDTVRSECKKCYCSYRKHKYHLNPEKYKKRAIEKYWNNGAKEKQQERLKKQKLIVYEHYGNKCSCCNEKEIAFLSIDHINGGGNKHRKKISKSSKTLPYRWIISNNFPETLQLLCMNCNFAKGKLGKCPHEGSN